MTHMFYSDMIRFSGWTLSKPVFLDDFCTLPAIWSNNDGNVQ